MNKMLLLTAALALILFRFSTASEQTLFAVVATSPHHAILTQLLNITGLSLYLNNASLFSTVFAPTDSEFNQLQYPQYYYVESDFWFLHLLALLSYHIVPEMLDLSQFFSLSDLPTLSPGVTIPVDKSNMTIDSGVIIVNSDIAASNGLVQIPDRVLMPHVLNLTVADMFFNTAVDASSVEQRFATNYSIFKKIFGMAQTSADVKQNFLSRNNFQGGLTLFAPPDSAFGNVEPSTIKLLLKSSTLAYVFILNHITNINFYVLPPPLNPIPFYMASGLSAWFSSVNEYQSRVDVANITDSILVGNGVINVINQVLLPPLTGYLLSVTTYVSDFNFSIFLNVVQGPANLTAVLYSETPLTLFAPVNEAFSTLPKNLLSRLQQPIWGRHLISLIYNHFTVGSLVSSSLPSRPTSLLMLSGYNTTVRADSADNVTIGHSQSVITDLTAFNGVIYGIDQVLLPPAVVDPIFYQLGQVGGLSTLIALIDSFNLTDLLNNTVGPLTLLAPDDAAFAAVGNLSNYSPSAIQTILLGHIFEGNIFTDNFPGSPISLMWNVSLSGGRISIGRGSIVSQDLLASNGVIQVISSVLISMAVTATAVPTAAPIVTASPVTIPTANRATSSVSDCAAQLWLKCILTMSVVQTGLYLFSI